MRKLLSLMLLASLLGCGTPDEEPQPSACEQFAAADFDKDSGWGSEAYCDSPTDLGCFPYHESAADTCGPFVTMRTSASPQAGVQACQTLLTTINCGTFTDGADTTLSFHIAEADRLTARVTGTYRGADVDTVLHFNPCDDDCLSAITLKTIEPEQQKICEIPRQGKPVCLFPETAHSLTIARYDSASIELRMAGQSVGLSRVVDE